MRNFCLKTEWFKENLPSNHVIFQDRDSTDSKDSDAIELKDRELILHGYMLMA